MPRQLRIQYPGAMYHVMSRGNRREDIFLDDVDRQDFLKTLAEGCQKTDWQVHAYCLMRNHESERGQPLGHWSNKKTLYVQFFS
jgi:REP element-mobilizing transposase RayT